MTPRLISVHTLCAALAWLGIPAPAGALTLTDQTSVIEIDETSVDGIYSWRVMGGTDQLVKEWFWYRIGDTAEASIDTLGLSASGDGTNTVTLTGSDPHDSFSIEIVLKLTGALTLGDSDKLEEKVTITNLTDSLLDLQFFEYTDLDLDGTAGNDDGVFSSSARVRQVDGAFATIESTTTAASPVGHAIGIDGSILAALGDGVATNLDNSNGPIFDENVEWAFQWGPIDSGAPLQFGKTKMLTPEPAPLLLVGMGLSALALGGRRRARLAQSHPSA